PYKVIMFRQEVWAVLLAPIAVDPDYQGEGIGSRLVEAGHRIARLKGYSFSMLLGYPDYYSRLGYLPRAFGTTKVTVATQDLPPSDLIARPLQEGDIPALYQLWEESEGAVDFALNPGTQLLDWISPNPLIGSTVFTNAEGEVVGYTRSHAIERYKPRVFLAQDNAVARSMVAHIFETEETDITEVILPLHPKSAAAAPDFGITSCELWEVAMVYPLLPSQFEIYYNQVAAGSRLPGRPIWPTAFDLD
ncbi:MAG: N-acetyltransferase, partial [Chloroflexota bacterium]